MKKIVLYLKGFHVSSLFGYWLFGCWLNFECGIHDKIQVVYKELTGGVTFKVTDNEFD